MNIWKISLKNIQSKPLYTVLSVLMLSLSIALLLGIQQLKTSFKYQMDNNLGDIDLVIGAKGRPLQLVLSSVLHLDNPTGNIPFLEAKKLGKNPLIKKAVPISYGDNYKGYRIVGTTLNFLSFYKAEIEEGKTFEKSMEVMLGYEVANQLNLKVGDTFMSSHGLIENEIDIHNDVFKVVGIFKPTFKVIDKLIITSLESIWDVHAHAHSHEEENHKEEEHHHEHEEEHNHTDEDKEITSLLVSFRSPTAVLTFPRNINENTNLQAALPKYELDKLYEFTGVGFDTISWIAYIILLISCVTIFINLYKMVKERAFDLALLRTYGANNFQLIKIVAYEGFISSFSALILGFLLSKVALYFFVNTFESSINKSIIIALPFVASIQIIGLVLLLIVLSIIFAIYPIIKMNISTILSNEK